PVGSGALSIPAGGALRVGETTQIVRVRRAVEVGEGGTSIELTAPLSSSLEAGTVLGVCTAEVVVRALTDALIEGTETVVVAIPADSTGQGLVTVALQVLDGTEAAAPAGSDAKPPPTTQGGGGGSGCGSGVLLACVLFFALSRGGIRCLARLVE
ncbi:MAG: hypothetical protein N3B15_05065, partial [Planctomycetota bacterium]|nr:hypothetical protein [Planctomycetota bacterium]